MTIRVALHHQSHYLFDRSVIAAPHEIRLRPAAHSRTPISDYALRIRPERHLLHWQQDAYGNFVARVNFPEPTREIDITVDLLAELTAINPFDFFLDEWAEHYPFVYPDTLAAALIPFLDTASSASGPRLHDWLAAFRREIPVGMNTIALLVLLNQRVRETVSYLTRLEPGVQTCEETLAKQIGSCRDSAWLLAQLLRHLGIASRFVSGYLIQLVADDRPLDGPGPSGPDADFVDLHAWCEAYIPGAGWVGMDATSGLLAGEGHIPLAVSALPTSAAPVTGTTSVCETRFEVRMTLTRIHEAPRLTRPDTERQTS